jgi:hypothetical protein
MNNAFSRQTQEAIAALHNCHITCLSMATVHCLEMGGEHARPQHLRLMLDCAAICAFTADALGRKSQFHVPFALLCAQVCQTCADDCTRLQDMDGCVTACRHCVAACQALAGPDADIRVEASQVAPSRNARPG